MSIITNYLNQQKMSSSKIKSYKIKIKTILTTERINTSYVTRAAVPRTGLKFIQIDDYYYIISLTNVNDTFMFAMSSGNGNGCRLRSALFIDAMYRGGVCWCARFPARGDSFMNEKRHEPRSRAGERAFLVGSPSNSGLRAKFPCVSELLASCCTEQRRSRRTEAFYVRVDLIGYRRGFV